MNRKSVLGTVLVGGKKEILSILSIDPSIPIILTRGVGDIENQRRVAKRRKRQVGGIYKVAGEGGGRKRKRGASGEAPGSGAGSGLGAGSPAGGAGGKPLFVGTVGGCSQDSFLWPL